MAIYTAECSHAFHFSCVISHVRKERQLLCPVCRGVWRDAPLLASVRLQDEGIKNKLSSQRHHFVEQVGSKKLADYEKMVTEGVKRPDSQRHFSKKYENGRSYAADDVKLVSPKYVTRFGPIPEEAEDFAMDSIRVEMNLSKEAAVISKGPTHDTYAIVLKVRAPVLPQARAAERRAPIDLVAVLDVSERMAGSKLELLKRAMELVISSLGSSDRLSVVASSSPPIRILPLTRMTPQGQLSARRIIRHLNCSRAATVGEALKQATKLLDERRERNPVSSIILLSGSQDESRLPASDEANRRRRVSPDSSTRFAHIEIPANSPEGDHFAKCVGGLLSVVVRDLRIHIAFGPGSDPGEITAVYPITQNPTLFGSDCTRLGDLFAEEEKEILIEIRVPASMIGSHHALLVKHNYKDPMITGKLINGEDRTLIVPYPRTAGSGSPRIVRLRNTFITTRAIAESSLLIERGDVDRALHLLSLARALLLDSGGSDHTDEVIRDLNTRIGALVGARSMKRHLRRHSDLYWLENAGF
ncbi:hypothetical protein M569_02429 [Genlisea aurea]|uniref:VWFA domain-containing protein n=1 Tax=Genlisea aurea TaxID=192259 RepID=S8CZ83_9LAMI|nr:hypothetical protein M569_02429 [Genlisea aurea]